MVGDAQRSELLPRFGVSSCWGFALLAATLLGPRSAAACQTTTCSSSESLDCVRDPTTSCWSSGKNVSWWQACTSFSAQAEGAPSLGLDYAAVEELVSLAFQHWTLVSCGAQPPSISVAPIGPIECGDVEYNPEGPNANAVLFRESGWVHEPNALAITTVVYQKSNGKLLDADMEVNLTNSSVTRKALPYVLAHEAGHFLGLDHSAVPSALMYAQYTPEERSGSLLTDDDVSSICAAYPQRDAGECDFAPEAGFDSRCGGDLSGGCALSGGGSEGRGAVPSVLLVVWVFRRASRRKGGVERAARSVERPGRTNSSSTGRA